MIKNLKLIIVRFEMNKLLKRIINKFSNYWFILKGKQYENSIGVFNIDVVIPITIKDLDLLEYCVLGIRENVIHAVEKIIVVSPCEDAIIKKCAFLNIEWKDEKQVIPEFVFDYPFKAHSRGWIFQQLIKLSADTISNNEHILICDADTVFIRPHCFKKNNKQILYCHSGVHNSYKTLLEDALNIKLHPIISYIANFILFDRHILAELKNKIEILNDSDWITAILKLLDDSEKAKLSEFELYGNYCWSKYSAKFIRLYWFNLALSRVNLTDYSILRERYSKKYKSISFHSYLN